MVEIFLCSKSCHLEKSHATTIALPHTALTSKALGMDEDHQWRRVVFEATPRLELLQSWLSAQEGCLDDAPKRHISRHLSCTLTNSFSACVSKRGAAPGQNHATTWHLSDLPP